MIPSAPLIVAAFALTVVVLSSVYLQFTGSRPSKHALIGAITAAFVGLFAIGVALAA